MVRRYTEMAAEQAITKATIKAFLDAGYFLTVDDGDEPSVDQSTDADAIYDACMDLDDAYLIVHKQGEETRSGWVRFVYGNEGYCLISDYTTNFESIIETGPVNAEVERWEAAICG